MAVGYEITRSFRFVVCSLYRWQDIFPSQHLMAKEVRKVVRDTGCSH